MDLSIGKYISQRLRSRGIFNKDAAKHIDLSTSAFEKILAQDDIHSSRLFKLSILLGENLFEYYTRFEPLKSFSEITNLEWQSKIDALSERVEAQQKRILDQEDVIRLLKEKEQFLYNTGQ